MQDLSETSKREVESARLQNRLLRDNLTRIKAVSASNSHTGNVQESFRAFLDLVTEERTLMEALETELERKQGKYEELLEETRSHVRSSLKGGNTRSGGLATLLEKENGEIEEIRRKIEAEVHTTASALNQLTVTEIQQDAELSQTSLDSTPRLKVPTLHKSGARLNESKRSQYLKPLDPRQ